MSLEKTEQENQTTPQSGETGPSCCDSACSCNAPAGRSNAKMYIGLAILAIAGCLFAYKLIGAKPAPMDAGKDRFSVATAPAPTNTLPVKSKPRIGETLESFSSLNSVATRLDAVLVVITANGSDSIGPESEKAVLAMYTKLKAQGAPVGLFTLTPTSPDRSDLARQLSLPAVIVLSKGQVGFNSVSGDITEDKLLQAYVASARAASCAPSGCGPSGCGPSGCGQ